MKFYDITIDIQLYDRDISVSVVDSAVLTKEFIITFLTEFYLQLTTISWLSVRTVQRQSKSIQDDSFSAPSSSEYLSGLFSTISSLVTSNVESVGRQDDWRDVDVDIISRAEERVRLAQELAHNNSLARARLGMTQIIR